MLRCAAPAERPDVPDAHTRTRGRDRQAAARRYAATVTAGDRPSSQHRRFLVGWTGVGGGFGKAFGVEADPARGLIRPGGLTGRRADPAGGLTGRPADQGCGLTKAAGWTMPGGLTGPLPY